LDIPEPNAPRFGMMQSPNKTSQEKYQQRRAQTAEFKGYKKGKSSPISRSNCGEFFSKPIENPLSIIQAEEINIKNDMLQCSLNKKMVDDEELLDEVIQDSLLIEHGQDEIARPHHLTKQDMKTILSTMAQSRQGNNRSKTASSAFTGRSNLTLSDSFFADSGSSPGSPKLIESDKWHPDGVIHALIGEKYGEVKKKFYR
jgi:hypothetical protein